MLINLWWLGQEQCSLVLARHLTVCIIFPIFMIGKCLFLLLSGDSKKPRYHRGYAINIASGVSGSAERGKKISAQETCYVLVSESMAIVLPSGGM